MRTHYDKDRPDDGRDHVASLVGAILGGLAGMRLHRRVGRDLAIG